MKGLLEEIRSQPPHIRELFMWLCVIITFSVVGFAWFRGTSQQLASLLHPETTALEERAIVERKPVSPFANLLLSFKDLTANIRTLFTFSRTTEVEVENQPSHTVLPTVSPRTLPLSP